MLHPGTRPNNYSFRPKSQLGSWAWSEQLFRCSKCSTPISTPKRTIIRYSHGLEAEANNKKNGKLEGEAWTPTPNKSESEVRIRARQPDWASPTLYASPNTPSVYAIFGLLCYHALSSVGLYGSLWLFSFVSVQVIEILVAFPVFALLSSCLLVHVAREPYLQAVL